MYVKGFEGGADADAEAVLGECCYGKAAAELLLSGCIAAV